MSSIIGLPNTPMLRAGKFPPLGQGESATWVFSLAYLSDV
ncbi:MAG: hypothetical protein RL497_1888 [Pseudomonadota bacterium]